MPLVHPQIADQERQRFTSDSAILDYTSVRPQEGVVSASSSLRQQQQQKVVERTYLVSSTSSIHHHLQQQQSPSQQQHQSIIASAGGDYQHSAQHQQAGTAGHFQLPLPSTIAATTIVRREPIDLATATEVFVAGSGGSAAQQQQHAQAIAALGLKRLALPPPAAPPICVSSASLQHQQVKIIAGGVTTNAAIVSGQGQAHGHGQIQVVQRVDGLPTPASLLPVIPGGVRAAAGPPEEKISKGVTALGIPYHPVQSTAAGVTSVTSGIRQTEVAPSSGSLVERRNADGDPASANSAHLAENEGELACDCFLFCFVTFFCLFIN